MISSAQNNFNANEKSSERKPESLLKKLKFSAFEPRYLLPSNELKKNSKIAFGRLGLNRLLRKIASEDEEICLNALDTLCDELRDPLKCFQAIGEFAVVKWIDRLWLKLYEKVFPCESTMERIAIALGIIATHYIGSEKIVSHNDLMKRIFEFAKKSTCINSSFMNIIVFMSRHPLICDEMIRSEHLKTLLEVMIIHHEREELVEAASNLIERDRLTAIKTGYFQFFYMQLTDNLSNIKPMTLKCFALLGNCEEGQKLCDEKDSVRLLYEVLQTEKRVDVLEFAALALQNLTNSKQSLWRCREFWNLPLVLIKGAHNKKSIPLNLYSLQTLRQITQVPCVKDFCKNVCQIRIVNIQCRHKSVQDAKDRLLRWLRWKPYNSFQEISTNVNSEHEEKIK